MPEPQRGEKLGDFVSKYMASKEARKRFPKKSQRAAIGYAKGEEAKLKK